MKSQGFFNCIQSLLIFVCVFQFMQWRILSWLKLLKHSYHHDSYAQASKQTQTFAQILRKNPIFKLYFVKVC